jgi:Peptidase A4 family
MLSTNRMPQVILAHLAGYLLAWPVAAQSPQRITQSPVPGQIAVRQHAPAKNRHRRFDGAVTSDNWSGYAVSGTNITDVKGSWIVPAATCSESSTPRRGRNRGQYSSFWVGIDGFSSNTVEQTGTDSDCAGGMPVYYAWFEFYPRPMYIVESLTISPGDIISAEVRYSASTGRFTVSMTDQTTGQSFSTSSIVSGAQLTSAEWITEAPSSTSGVLPLADFGLAYFGSDFTGVGMTSDATVNGITGSIASFGSAADSITMTLNGAEEAVPSNLSSDGTSFTVTWH